MIREMQKRHLDANITFLLVYNFCSPRRGEMSRKKQNFAEKHARNFIENVVNAANADKHTQTLAQNKTDGHALSTKLCTPTLRDYCREVFYIFIFSLLETKKGEEAEREI